MQIRDFADGFLFPKTLSFKLRLLIIDIKFCLACGKERL